MPNKQPPHAPAQINTNKDITQTGRDVPFECKKSKTLDTPVDIDVFLDPKTPEFARPGLINEQEPSVVAPLSDIWAHEFKMGPGSYVDCLAANDAISEQLKIEWAPNTRFSEHVGTLKSILKAKWDGMGRDLES
ncbi:hypothetical protein N7508_010973 [Penicillium antarcticum]|uniref:uncharacterized protein n=1 Tax=Penicillium antarcticum TaxID=416450 RepID=UPI0023A6E398|nr:uncharacterized protein N7508_010973 [Penicillium antarcticum]KAJ5296152.1 hypothetical protein N7508_010973 [Penicillium antarcticum]